MIHAIAALKTEVAGFSHPRVAVTICGVGFEKARAAAEAIGDAELLVSAGFCGALDASLRTGDLIAGGTVRERRRFEGDPRAIEAVPDARRGDTLWVPSVQTTLEAADALAVDMESAAVAEIAAARGVPFLMLRAVLDTPDAPLAGDYTWRMLLKPWRWPGVPRDARRAKVAAAALAKGLLALADGYEQAHQTQP